MKDKKLQDNAFTDRRLKSQLQQILRNDGIRAYARVRTYLKEEGLQKDLYGAWIKKNETTRKQDILYSYSSKFLKLNLQQTKEGMVTTPKSRYMVFVGENKVITNYTISSIEKELKTYPDTDLLYTDEDHITSEGKRYAPFFKPSWSPDTLMSLNYFGGLFVVRTSLLKQIEVIKSDNPEVCFYDMLLKLTEVTTHIRHIPKVLCHNPSPVALTPDSEEIKQIKEEALRRRGIAGKVSRESYTGKYHVQYLANDTPSISIVIPSKDNISLLSQCLSSIREKTGYRNYDICVVDNGSTAENKKEIERLLKEYRAAYLYTPMEFNFSKMCNLGASKTKGEYLLFLNDDIEVLQAEWLEIMVGHACQKHTGAVGAKLLYPNSRTIQHVGVTNLAIGPAHKLSLLEDTEDHYFGRNHLEYNYLAVTGACLMVNRKKFEEAGGFDEAMKVRYNDVELCCSLYEKGYYNVVRNDVVLYHHESVSRGDDTLSEEKMGQLVKEREYLYSKHPQFANSDPFYNPNLIDHKTLYEPNYIYDFEKRDLMSKYRYFKKTIPPEWMNESLRMQLEIKKYKDGVWYLEGWAYVMGTDNSAYNRYLVLREEKEGGEMLKISTLPRYRKDVAEQFPDEKNIGLSGFVCRIPDKILKKNIRYQIALLAKAKYSRQVLFTMSEEQIGQNLEEES